MPQTPNYLLIGHIAHDETPTGPKLGGTVSYSGSAAAVLGANVAIVTSARKDDVVLSELPAQSQVHLVEAPDSTIFVNTYIGDVRKQIIRSRAAPLSIANIPDEWRTTPIVQLGPLADELDTDLAGAFPDSLVAATPQGWMRTWNSEGIIQPKQWSHAETLLPILDAVIFSEEDIHRDIALEAHYASLANLLIVTRGPRGCTVYQRGMEHFNVAAPTVTVVDATGAGDVFAGTFLWMFYKTQNVRRAAEIATQLATLSVTRVGLAGIPTPDEISRISV
jgi:1D-myo-inositol 3-kinase